MIRATILALEESPLTSLALPADILNAAGTLWNRMAGQPERPLFDVSIVTPGGKQVSCYRTIDIKPNGSFEELESVDIVVIAALGNMAGFQEKYQEQINHLNKLHERGAVITSICTGAFLMAETGLLKGKSATTHWGMSKFFSELYPDVRLRTSRTIVDEKTLISSGGTTAGSDLALYIIRRWCGNEVANQAARVLLLDPYRLSQAPYEAFYGPVDHGDDDILLGQKWIDSNFYKEITIDSLAEKCNLSRRTFERRFKKATGDSPLRYLQRVRIEKAKYLLEYGNLTFDIITSKVGYEDTSSFRRIFQKTTGLPPRAYREKFRNSQILTRPTCDPYP